nr:hypothetical protein [Photobacterium jeanii]
MLSNRSHPDKGGSKALMQMVRQAYEQVMKGNGEREAVRTIVKKDPSGEKYREQLKALEKIHEDLRFAFDENQSRLKKTEAELNHLRNTQSQSSVDDYELTQLRRENLRLKRELKETQLDLAAATRSKSTDVRARDYGSSDRNDTNSPTFTAATGAFQQVKNAGVEHKRKFMVMLLLPALIIAAMLLPAGEHISTILSFFDKPAAEENTRPVIMDVNPIDQAQREAQERESVVMSIPEKPKALPMLKLVRNHSRWHVDYFAENQMPYIAIRSEGGSYVVRSCDGIFKYYLNQNQRSRRLPANLIYERKDRHFAVYKMPYGNGSTLEQWSGSKSLLINDEYFPNAGFDMAYYELINACQVTR